MAAGLLTMPVPAVCPACGAKFPLEAAITDAEARRALAAALKLPDAVARRLVPYLALHAPAGRAMAWSKTARLVDELVALVQEGSVKRGANHPRAAPPAVWALALDECTNARDQGRLDLPLDGHGWLAGAAYKIAGRKETAQRGATPPGRHASHRPAERPDLPRRGSGGETGVKAMKDIIGRAAPTPPEDQEEQTP